VYERLARWCFNNAWKVVGGWALTFVAILIATASIGPAYDGSFEIPESDSASGFEVIETYFGGAGAGLSGSIVFQAEQGVEDDVVKAAMVDLFETIQSQSGDGETFEQLSVRSPYTEGNEANISPSGQIAYASINLPNDTDQVAAQAMGAAIDDLIEDEGLTEIDGLRVEIGGAAFGEFEPPESEVLGLAFAVLVLTLAVAIAVGLVHDHRGLGQRRLHRREIRVGLVFVQRRFANDRATLHRAVVLGAD